MKYFVAAARRFESPFDNTVSATQVDNWLDGSVNHSEKQENSYSVECSDDLCSLL